LTGAFEPIDQDMVTAVGCDGVLAKPFEPQLVIGRVKELLGKTRQPVPQVDLQLQPVHAASDASTYFDRLDAAFANMANAPHSEPKGKAVSVADEIDWFTSLSPAQAAPEPPPPAVFAPAAAPQFPPLADAFAAILAAEQSGQTAVASPAWVAATPAPTPAPEITDDILEEVTRRVLERMSDGVVRETVARIVSEVAERLIREEIDKIKGAIK
jgi:hypothetical protein